MKKLLWIAAASVLVSCGGSGGSPGDAVTGMMDAIKAGDGETAVSYVSSSALEQMDSQLQVLKADPEASAQQLAMLGIQIDAEDIPDMTARDFAIAMISSPTVTSIMESAEVSIGETSINGDSAKVEVTVTVNGQTETNTVDVVREDGQWKVSQFGLNM